MEPELIKAIAEAVQAALRLVEASLKRKAEFERFERGQQRAEAEFRRSMDNRELELEMERLRLKRDQLAVERARVELEIERARFDAERWRRESESAHTEQGRDEARGKQRAAEERASEAESQLIRLIAYERVAEEVSTAVDAEDLPSLRQIASALVHVPNEED